MTRNVRTVAIPAVAAAGAAALLGSGVASAADVIPGDNTDSVNIITGSDALQISVGDVDTNGKVSVEVKNTSNDQGFTCQGVSGTSNSGLITEPDVVSQSMDYYASGPLVPGPFASLAALSPGLAPDTSSLGSLANDRVQAQNAVQDAQEDAMLAGHTADLPGFTVSKNSGGTNTQTFDTALNAPADGDFDPAVFIVCTGDNDDITYAFAGYNGSDSGGGAGSMSSLTGSLGSSDGSMGS